MPTLESLYSATAERSIRESVQLLRAVGEQARIGADAPLDTKDVLVLQSGADAMTDPSAVVPMDAQIDYGVALLGAADPTIAHVEIDGGTRDRLLEAQRMNPHLKFATAPILRTYAARAALINGFRGRLPNHYDPDADQALRAPNEGGDAQKVPGLFLDNREIDGIPVAVDHVGDDGEIRRYVKLHKLPGGGLGSLGELTARKLEDGSALRTLDGKHILALGLFAVEPAFKIVVPGSSAERMALYGEVQPDDLREMHLVIQGMIHHMTTEGPRYVTLDHANGGIYEIAQDWSVSDVPSYGDTYRNRSGVLHGGRMDDRLGEFAASLYSGRDDKEFQVRQVVSPTIERPWYL